MHGRHDSGGMHYRQREYKRRPVVEFAFGADSAAVSEHDVLGDRQSQTRATGFARAGFVHTIEALEQARQALDADARAGVAHGALGNAIPRPRSQHDTTPGPATPSGIVD